MSIIPNEPEKAFLKRLQAKDAATIRQFIEQYFGPLYLLVVLLNCDPDKSGVIIKKTFTTAMERINSYDPTQVSLWIWLVRIMTPQLDIHANDILKRVSTILKEYQ